MKINAIKLSTKLQEILNREGISKADLGRAKGLNPTTVYYLCKNPKYYKRTRELTRHKILNAIHDLGTSKKQYKLDEIFPR